MRSSQNVSVKGQTFILNYTFPTVSVTAADLCTGHKSILGQFVNEQTSLCSSKTVLWMLKLEFFNNLHVSYDLLLISPQTPKTCTNHPLLKGYQKQVDSQQNRQWVG